MRPEEYGRHSAQELDMHDPSSEVLRGMAAEAFARREAAGAALAGAAERLANACHDMALRFLRGGKLLAFGNGGPSTDAQHVSVEFVHPVRQACAAGVVAGD
jgi:phosphoheptose isomerase